MTCTIGKTIASTPSHRLASSQPIASAAPTPGAGVPGRAASAMATQVRAWHQGRRQRRGACVSLLGRRLRHASSSGTAGTLPKRHGMVTIFWTSMAGPCTGLTHLSAPICELSESRDECD